MKLEKIAQVLAVSDKMPDIDILWLLTDSRSLSFPAESLFFALKTEKNDGHRYIAELYKQNVRFFVVSDWHDEFEKMSDAYFLKVENTLEALHKVAIAKRSEFDVKTVGITGSNGKTTVKEWLYQLLKNDVRIARSPRSYNSQIGVPLSVWSLNKSTELALFEAGISLPNEMEKLEKIIQPTIGVFTHLGDAHQKGFQSLRQKIEEKVKLFSKSQTIIYRADDKQIDEVLKEHFPKERLFSWGSRTDNNVQIISLEKQKNSTFITLKKECEQSEFVLPFSNDATVENALTCVAVLVNLGYSLEQIKTKITDLEPVEMRLEVKEGAFHSVLIDDTYNLDYGSLEIATTFQANQSVGNNLTKTLILSDILQSAYDDEKLYKMVASLVASKGIEKLVGIGQTITKFSHFFELKNKEFYASTDDFIRSLNVEDFANQLILLKGAREFHFEKIVSKLQKTVHQTTLEVNLNALVENFNTFKKKLNRTTKVMGMVKAFGYGSGSVEVARALQHHGCDYLAVALADEGAELRKEGIIVPIVVMNPEENAFDTILNNKLEPEIYSFHLLNSFVQYAEKQGVVDYPIHLKLDSGMHRLGFDSDDCDTLIDFLKNQNQVKIKSIFSHLAGADSEEFDEFTKQQIETFDIFAERLKNAFSHKILKHILNSSGIERFADYQFDMVRLGIGMYGVSAMPKSDLQNVCVLKTVILQTKKVKKGETVGYSRRGKMAKDSVIGVIPIGYADGFERLLGNGLGEVFVNGRRVKTVGNICMDLAMIDLTDVEAKVGDKVEIFGKNITIFEVADKLNTIPYEVLTSVSRRVKRVYFLD